MKIKVPAYALDYNLNDYELLFSCFMAFIAKEYGYKNIRYYMYADDVKHLLGFIDKNPTRNVMVPDGRHTHKSFGTITDVFRFGFITQDTFTVEFIRRPEYEFRNGQIMIEEAEITDFEVIKLYYYMIGRLTAEDIVDDEVKISRKKASWMDTAIKPFFREHFML